MTGREKYNIYSEMCNKIPSIIEEIRTKIVSNNGEVLSDIFVAVANEETREYFVDVEYKMPVTGYHRLYTAHYNSK